MTRVKVNIIANFLGQGWVYALQLVLVPMYLKLVGIEAYGLIGFFVMLSTTMQVFDLGLAQTTNREVARWSADPTTSLSPRTILRTLEPIYLLVGVLLGASIVVLSPVIAHRLIKADALPAEVVAESVRLMAAAVTLQWMQTLYLSTLAGLQRQVAINLYRGCYAALSGLGGIIALVLVSAQIETLFRWYVAASAGGLLGAALLVRSTLPRDPGDRGFQPALLRRIWRFAAGSSLINMTALAVSQADKWILLAIVSLEKFAYYAIASSLASALYGVVGPVLGAVFPRLTALVARGDEIAIRGVYGAASQLVSALAFPLGLTLALFSQEVLVLWTRSEAVAAQSSTIATILVLGTMLNCAMFVPYNLQLAYGWTRLGLSITVGFLVTMVPASIVLANRYGPIGAASVWLALNVAYFAVGVPLTHRRVLKGAASGWYLRDVLPPLLAALLVVGLARLALPAGIAAPALVAFLITVVLGAAAASVFSVPFLRGWVGQRLALVRAGWGRPSV